MTALTALRRALLAFTLGLTILAATASAQAPAGHPAAAAKPVQAAAPAAGMPSPQPAPQPAPAPPPSPENQALIASLDESRKIIEDIEASAGKPDVSDKELQTLRSRLDPLTDRLRAQISVIEPKLDAARVRLNQLGPKPKDVAEGADVARDRSEREQAVSELDESLKIARALLVQGEQLTRQISDLRRANFARAIFQRSYSILSPDLWLSAIKSSPRDLLALHQLAGDIWWQLEYRASPSSRLLFGLALAAGLILHLARRRIVPRIILRNPAASGIKPGRQLRGALHTLLIETLPAVLASLIVYQALISLDLVPYRALPLAWAIPAGVAFLAFVKALIDAIFAPDAPAWRLVQIPERMAGAILDLGTIFAAVIVVGRILDALNQSIAAAFPVTIAAKGIVAILAAAVLGLLLLRLSEQEADASDEASLGPYVPTASTVSAPVRTVGWIVVATVAVASVAGYVAFATFLLDQILWISSIAGLLFLALRLCDHFVAGTLSRDSRLSMALQSNLGLRKKALQQIGLIASGALKIDLWLAAAMLALAPWGIESGDFTTSLKAAFFFGMKVGGVTISLSSVALALLLFGAVIGVTRLLRNWLNATFLPTTDLDAGLRNSIATATSYLGFFLAISASFGFLGLSLEKIAIVAGALSVGIGFGLQSIVNNFVSGLILLWERPIKVGDLVVVGGDEGYVRRISVRATEIETSERSTIIVPNSSLISGTVKNRMRQDVTGRVVIPVKVLRSQDAARAAELLAAEAAAHPSVLKEPPPRVFFRKIGETWLDFDLICIVPDIAIKSRVESELNFAILTSLSAEGIFPPLGPDSRNILGLEPVQDALQAIAAAIAAREQTKEHPADRNP